MRFQAVIEPGGKSATGIEVPGHVLEALASGKRPKVKVTINGYSYPSSVGSLGGRSLIPVSAEVRGRAGVAAGDTVEVDVVPDTEERQVDVPPDLSAALRGGTGAVEAFERLSYSNQRRYVLSIEGAKTAETRQRRIEKAVADLASARWSAPPEGGVRSVTARRGPGPGSGTAGTTTRCPGAGWPAG
jgi:hypothetical protein